MSTSGIMLHLFPQKKKKKKKKSEDVSIVGSFKSPILNCIRIEFTYSSRVVGQGSKIECEASGADLANLFVTRSLVCCVGESSIHVRA